MKKQGLSIRASNVLSDLSQLTGIDKTPVELKKFFLQDVENQRILQSIPNCGKKTIKEIFNWCGFSPEEQLTELSPLKKELLDMKIKAALSLLMKHGYLIYHPSLGKGAENNGITDVNTSSLHFIKLCAESMNVSKCADGYRFVLNLPETEGKFSKAFLQTLKNAKLVKLETA